MGSCSCCCQGREGGGEGGRGGEEGRGGREGRKGGEGGGRREGEGTAVLFCLVCSPVP